MNRDGDRLSLEGPLNIQTVPAVLRFGLENFADGATTVDFAGVTEVDSSAIAMAIEWVRAVRVGQAGKPAGAGLHFVNMPQSMISLAQLYGLAGLLPVA
jgi:phospholipid transport system transporter-binding protein